MISMQHDKAVADVEKLTRFKKLTKTCPHTLKALIVAKGASVFFCHSVSVKLNYIHRDSKSQNSETWKNSKGMNTF